MASTICIVCGRDLDDPWSIREEMGPICKAKVKALMSVLQADDARVANYRVLEVNDDHVLIKDVGPWDRYPTITNSAEAVVIEVARLYPGKRILYADSDGVIDELLVVNGRFGGFKAGGAR